LRRPRQPESLKRLFVLLALAAMLIVVVIMGATMFTR
jgi:hypothetical protein